MVYRSAMLDRIRTNTRAAALLAGVFDFDVTRLEPVEPVRLASGGELRAVAGDASGGTFFLCDDGPVLYADSEGGAAIVAADSAAVIRLVVVCRPGTTSCRTHLTSRRCAPPSNLPTPN